MYLPNPRSMKPKNKAVVPAESDHREKSTSSAGFVLILVPTVVSVAASANVFEHLSPQFTGTTGTRLVGIVLSNYLKLARLH